MSECLSAHGRCISCGNTLFTQATVVRLDGQECDGSYDTGDGRKRVEGAEVAKYYECLHCRRRYLRRDDGVWVGMGE